MSGQMQDHLLQLLTDTQSTSAGPRKQAELTLRQLQQDDAFPTSLSAIAVHDSVSANVRLSALNYLRILVEKNWAGLAESTPVTHISDPSKELLRGQLLELAINTGDNVKVKNAASYVVSKIASVDYPDDWPILLPTLLHVIPTGSDIQIHGALKVLRELVEDSLNEDQFFSVARDIVKVVYEVSVNEGMKLTLRAMAMSVFRGCFDIMDMVKDEHGPEVKGFAEEALAAWSPLFMDIMGKPLPPPSKSSDEDYEGARIEQASDWPGLVALKLQVVKTLMKIRNVFPQLLLPQIATLFTAAWHELSTLQDVYTDMYLDHDEQGRLEDSDGLPYTLDFLILEELDFLQSCLRAPPVQTELQSQLQSHGGVASTPWIMDIMKLAVTYAQITNEEEGLWDIDVNLFLSEETSVTTNYTARTACGDLLIKLGEWLHEAAAEGLLGYTKSIFAADSSAWRSREASLFLLTQLANDFLDRDQPISSEIVASYLEFVEFAVNREDNHLLRARGYLVVSVLVQTYKNENFLGLFDRNVKAINSDEAEVVMVACIKAIEGFIKANIIPADRQIPIAVAISDFLSAKDFSDLEESNDLLITLVESLRATIRIDPRICIAPGSGVLDLLFTMARYGASDFQLTMLVNETFEDTVGTIASHGGDAYSALCSKVLPSLTGAFDVGSLTNDDPLLTLATELLAVLTENGSEPLPPGYISAAMPKLIRLLLNSLEGEILRPGVESMKFMLMHDHQQVFAWHDDTGRSGLEVCLVIIDRLLGPTMEDNAASEVGGLAAELVEKAGQERLGPYLSQLLQAVASRLATAEAAPFIQSLILVFARLSLVGAHDVVEFLTQIQINDQSGLQVVMSKWLEHSISFAGYDEIRQNVIALSKLYSLNDPRLAQTMVKGDLVVPTSDRIMTRSRTKQTPDQYTIIPANLKILKVLIEELLSASGMQNAAAAAAANSLDDDDAGDDDGWEDMPSSTLDLGLGSTKQDLMAWASSSDQAAFVRQKDDETQAYLTEFFVKAAHENTAGFNELYGALTDGEREKLAELARDQQLLQQQQQQ